MKCMLRRMEEKPLPACAAYKLISALRQPRPTSPVPHCSHPARPTATSCCAATARCACATTQPRWERAKDLFLLGVYADGDKIGLVNVQTDEASGWLRFSHTSLLSRGIGQTGPEQPGAVVDRTVTSHTDTSLTSRP